MVIKRDMSYSPKGENRTLHIYLPEGYEESDERYPVMYFFDGHNLYYDADATYGKSWGIKEFLDHYDKKMIVVGMECSHVGQDRLGEYSPYRAFSGMFSELTPLGYETMEWIVNEIKPMIDREYRTWSHREATGIGGSSMGGLMAIYGITKFNHIFSKGACISSAIGFCFSQLMKEIDGCHIEPDTRAFLSWGTKEAFGVTDHSTIDCHSGTYRRNKAVENKLLSAGAMSQLYCQLGGGHCEADWEKLVPYFMDFLWK